MASPRLSSFLLLATFVLCPVDALRFAPTGTIGRAQLRAGPPTATLLADTASPASLLRERVKQALGDGSAESLRAALLRGDDESVTLPQALSQLVGPTLAPRVADLAHATPDAKALGDFEDRVVELMASERWLDAHDVVAGALEEWSEQGAHAHEAVQAARLLEGVCQHALSCVGGLSAALEAHELAQTKSELLPCGCVVDAAAVEPFADLANSVAALDAGDANSALGHALAAGLARPPLAAAASRLAHRAEAALELLPATIDVDAFEQNHHDS